ncbi:MAG: DNA topoisomerase I [Gammaproteobacteria bacterium]|nr:DNA topoisomerase I [Gammaproteobacteria bacterium]
MGHNLVIVESPAKATTIKKYLGPGFDVLASYGHVRDLLPKEGAVDTDHDFSMTYEIIERNAKYVDAITRSAKKADALYLATDLDREGEAISWHILELLKERKALDGKKVCRVIFHEITPRAIAEAVANPREISTDLVNAQQARRALDYLVGFNLSPLLWKKIRRGLSAGRVQSPALRLICEREAEIEKFKPREYWTVDADMTAAAGAFSAKLARFGGEKIKQFSIVDQQQAEAVRTAILAGTDGQFTVISIEKKQRRRNPAPPFITSTLQQEAVRKLGFTAQRAMRVAQQLYEGVDIGNGAEGLITYMRTDSVNLAQEALDELRGFIQREFGAAAVPPKPHVYKTKSKNAQEAHEAIRPTSVLRTPKALKSHLAPDLFKLYELIWKRTVACQMSPALIDAVAAELKAEGDAVFRATGVTVAEPGFLAVYAESEDEDAHAEEGGALPAMKEGEKVKLDAVRIDQHFTEPPPRYSEASLVKTLEEYGIGRPSTYASIISTLLQRDYVELTSKRFCPTDIGRIVNNFLTSHFGHYVDYDFTARLEDELDAVSRGEKDWIPLLREFWEPFRETVQDKEVSVSRKEAMQARQLGTDPVSGLPVSARMGRYGPYIAVGDPDDENAKPKFFGLRSGQRIDTITLDEALALTKLPRQLGQTPEGLAVSANIGRFGPYVRYGDKFVSLKGDDDPYTVTLARAIELIEAKKAADAARELRTFPDSPVRVLNGRFGPYVTDGEKNARLPKDLEPAALTLAQCVELLATARPAFGRGRKNAKPASRAASKTAPEKTAGSATPSVRKTVAKAKAASKTQAKPKPQAAAKKAAKRVAKKTSAQRKHAAG